MARFESAEKKFDESHTTQIATLTEKANTARKAADDAKTAADKKQKEKETFLQEKSPIDLQLSTLETGKKTHAGFAEQFEQLALENFERQLIELQNRQQEALTETAESVQKQLETAQNEIEATTKSIQQFSRLAIASLREHFTDEEISRLFRILNPDLLGLAVGRTGITLSNSKEVVARLRQLVSKISQGVYQDDSMTVRLEPAGDVLSKFQSVESLEKELERKQKNVVRLTFAGGRDSSG